MTQLFFLKPCYIALQMGCVLSNKNELILMSKTLSQNERLDYSTCIASTLCGGFQLEFELRKPAKKKCSLPI